MSRAEEVMRECDIHPACSIKTTNSAVYLICKPGLDLCCDLLKYLQGVLRACRKKKKQFHLVFTLSYVDFARPITEIVFHMKCNLI